MLHFRLELNLTSKPKFTLPRELEVTSWLAFIKTSKRLDYSLPGDVRLGLWTTCDGVVLTVGKIAIAFLSLTWDICIMGPKGFALGSVNLSLATLI